MLRIATCTGHCYARSLSGSAARRPSLAAKSTRLLSPWHLPGATEVAARSMATVAAAASGQEPAAPAAAAAAVDTSSGAPADPLLQYVVLRRDLWTELDWPLGSVIAQGCHAATAALWESRDAAPTLEYCAPENIDHMHKVVLEIKGEAQLRQLAAKLADAGVPHKLWVEQPEDFATCLATAPACKSLVAPHVKKLKLCKGT